MTDLVKMNTLHACSRFFLSKRYGLLGLFLISAACSGHKVNPDSQRAAPEAAHAVEFVAENSVRAERRMVAAANPLAAQAGLDILRWGGSAIDAAVTIQLVLTLVEPQSSGIGGGGFLLYHDAGTGLLSGYDGRETAPAAARPNMFLDADGGPRSFYDAAIGGLAVGAPGVLRLLETAHKRHGVLPWAALFEPAITLAENGFHVTPRLHALLVKDPFLRDNPRARALYYRLDGTALPVGTLLRNRDLADTLRLIAALGPDVFYQGGLSDEIVTAVRTARRNPGLLSREDMAAYTAKKRTPVCRPYRVWRVCGFPPPTSGGVTLLQALGILENIDLSGYEALDSEITHWLAEAGRLAYADRARYLADADFVEVPVKGLLDGDYLGRRAAALKAGDSLDQADPGRPPGLAGQKSGLADGDSLELPSTTHFVIVDDAGNAVSMTSSIESAFGSRLMVGGFLLNNQLTDFSFRAEVNGRPVANRVEPGKRPRSSMAPVMVSDAENRLVLLTGSPGGSRIINYVLEHLVRVLDLGLDPQAAMMLPHAGSRNGPTEMELGRGLDDLANALARRGHETRFTEMTSGLHTIQILPDGELLGAADPRREGVAVGD